MAHVSSNQAITQESVQSRTPNSSHGGYTPVLHWDAQNNTELWFKTTNRHQILLFCRFLRVPFHRFLIYQPHPGRQQSPRATFEWNWSRVLFLFRMARVRSPPAQHARSHPKSKSVGLLRKGLWPCINENRNHGARLVLPWLFPIQFDSESSGRSVSTWIASSMSWTLIGSGTLLCWHYNVVQAWWIQPTLRFT